jgi:hypothetical protein
LVRRLIISFSSIIRGYNVFLATLAIGSDSDLFISINAEEQEHQLLPFIGSSLDDNGDDLNYGAAFIRAREILSRTLNIHLILKEAKFSQIIT